MHVHVYMIWNYSEIHLDIPSVRSKYTTRAAFARIQEVVHALISLTWPQHHVNIGDMYEYVMLPLGDLGASIQRE